MVLTVDEVKTHLRIEEDDEDAYIGILIAQAQGMESEEKTRRIIGTLFCLEVLLSLIIGIACVLFADAFLSALETPLEAFAQAKAYTLRCRHGNSAVQEYARTPGTQDKSSHDCANSCLRGFHCHRATRDSAVSRILIQTSFS